MSLFALFFPHRIALGAGVPAWSKIQDSNWYGSMVMGACGDVFCVATRLPTILNIKGSA